MKKTLFFVLLLLLLSLAPSAGKAQSMALELIGSSGGTAASGDFSLSWSAGEMNIAAAVQGSHYLGAGFQQAKRSNTTVGLFQALLPGIDFKAFPNPATDYLIVESNTTGLTLRMYDLLGRQVLADVLLNGQEQLHLEGLPAGMYLLQVLDEHRQIAGVSKIQHY